MHTEWEIKNPGLKANVSYAGMPKVEALRGVAGTLSSLLGERETYPSTAWTELEKHALRRIIEEIKDIYEPRFAAMVKATKAGIRPGIYTA